MRHFLHAIRAACVDWQRAWRKRRAQQHTLGFQGERFAERYLRRLGWRVVARSSRDRLGEIDLIALDGLAIVFVEVKTRRRGEPHAAVDPAKQRRLTRLALAWLKRQRLLEHPARFDVISLVWPRNSLRPELRHFRHAFEAQGHGQFFA